MRGERSRGFDQKGAIAAVDTATGKELWTFDLYRTQYDPQEDVRDVYCHALGYGNDGTQLVADSEDRKSRAINLSDHVVKVLR